MLDIADDGRNDWMQKLGADGENTGWQVNPEAIRRSQLRIDARKWMVVKMLPRKYGDKQSVQVGYTHEDWLLEMLKVTGEPDAGR